MKHSSFFWGTLPLRVEIHGAYQGEAGRDPRAPRLIITANIKLHSLPPGPERLIFTGTPAEIVADLAAPRRLGAAEPIFNA
jgi:hypothetical protein